MMDRSRPRLVRLSPRLRRVWDGDGDCVYRMGAFDCLPAILRLPGNTSATGAGRHRVGSRSGLIVSPPASYPMRLRILCPFPAPSPRAASSRAHPIPSRFVPSYPPNPLDCFAPIALIAITPRLPCRANGADFLNASNSMPLKSGLRSDSFLAACLPSYGFPAAPSAHLIISSLIISSRYASLSLLTAVPFHHGVGLRMEPLPHHSPPLAPPIV